MMLIDLYGICLLFCIAMWSIIIIFLIAAIILSSKCSKEEEKENEDRN